MLTRNVSCLCLVHLLLLFIFELSNFDTAVGASTPPESQAQPPSSRKILLLDVDNTLYRETEARIEHQIIRGIHSFCYKRLNLTGTECDDLHRQYGSTIEGIRQQYQKPALRHRNQLFPNQDLEQLLHDFYRDVYESVDVKSLLPSPWLDSTQYSTGYTQHQDSLKADRYQQLRQILTSAPCDLYLASNSPQRHVCKVIQAMGLARVPWMGALTPDVLWPPHLRNASTVPFPTKSGYPIAFFGSLFHEKTDITLLDDSPAVLKATSRHFPGILVTHNTVSITQALAVALGWMNSSFVFSDVDYLRAKNCVDIKSINRKVWNDLHQQLWKSLDVPHNASTLVIVDLGAGLLSMLQLSMHGYYDPTKPDNDLKSLQQQWNGTPKDETTSSSDNSQSGNVTQIHYYAYEPNLKLEYECLQVLKTLGYERTKTFQWDRGSGVKDSDSRYEPEHILVHQMGNTKWIVHLRMWNYECNEKRHQLLPHLIIGCCFADLLPPQRLAQSIVRRLLTQKHQQRVDADVNHTLVYFPITFAGTTLLAPPLPCQDPAGDRKRLVPSDTMAMSLYSHALEVEQGHNLDPHRLVESLEQYGAKLVTTGSSEWVIDPTCDEYLWRTFMYFFGTTAGWILQHQGWDARLWLDRTRQRMPTIHVCNVDLLFRIPRLGCWELEQDTRPQGPSPTHYREIQFQAPRRVGTVDKPMANLQEHEVRVKAVASLISSGTELKVFTGSFDDSAALDVNIDGMDDQRMAYPLAYGYSLVGRVVECGRHANQELLGKLVFCFSPHATHAVVHEDALQVVPDGIDAFDAIFMPSMETALSLVHDANLRFGERVAVFGQGLIGLLVTGILSLTNPQLGASRVAADLLTTVDTKLSRLAFSSQMGSMQAITPSAARTVPDFDVTIEVSGNKDALQTAIDVTRDGGLVVVGSWYGNSKVALRLGIDFHRSHKVIKASQVSEIPVELSGRWTKSRRFELAWDLVRKVQPSRLLTRRMSLDEAQEAYRLLETGDELAIAIEYSI